MKAVIVTGGKQYSVSEGDVIYVEKLNAEAESTVSFDQVLAVGDGENATFGTPVVSGAVVEGKVIKNGKAKKVVVFKYTGETAPTQKELLLVPNTTKLHLFDPETEKRIND